MLTYSRAELKQDAKAGLSNRWGLAIGSMLLALFVPSLIIGFVEGLLSTFSSLCLSYQSYGIAGLLGILSSLFSLAAIIFFVGPLSMGYEFFSLRFVRGMNVNVTLPYRAFSSSCYMRLTVSFLMMNIFIFLWSLLFVIPGIIKSFSYAQMPYILMDHPEMGWKEALEESKRMMNGHKMDYFVLLLSFIPWLLLCGITFGIAFLYVGPYMQMTCVNFYRGLKEEQHNVTRVLNG